MTQSTTYQTTTYQTTTYPRPTVAWLTVAILFLEEVVSMKLERVAAGFFIVAIGLLMWALTLFLRETQVAAAALRIPRDFLDH